MDAQRHALALAAFCAAMLVPVAVAQAGGSCSIRVCHGTGSSSNGFVLVTVNASASLADNSQQSSADFAYNPWYASCAEQYADMCNH